MQGPSASTPECTQNRAQSSELNGDAANADEPALYVHIYISHAHNNMAFRKRMRTMLLFWQHTADPLHDAPESTPMTLMGVQSTPTSASMPCTTTPSSPRILLMLGSLAYPQKQKHGVSVYPDAQKGNDSRSERSRSTEWARCCTAGRRLRNRGGRSQRWLRWRRGRGRSR